MKKEKWYLKNSPTIIRVDDIKEFTDLFVNHIDQFTEKMKMKMIQFQQSQLNGIEPKKNPMLITITDDEFDIVSKKIRFKLPNKKTNLSIFGISASMERNRIDIVFMSQSYFDKIKAAEEEKKNLSIEQETVTKEIVEEQK